MSVNLEFQHFPGEDPRTPLFKGRGGKGKGGEERAGERKGKERGEGMVIKGGPFGFVECPSGLIISELI